MIHRKGQVGQIILSFPSLIFIFLIMLIFVVVSSVMTRTVSQSDSPTQVFLSSYLFIETPEGPAQLSVNDALKYFCEDISSPYALGDLRVLLREEFRALFGDSAAFALVSRFNGGPGGWGYYIYAWAGVFSDSYAESKLRVQRFPFYDAFGYSSDGRSEITKFCDSRTLYVRAGGISS